MMYIVNLLEGFLANVVITLLSSLFPLILGTLLSLWCKKSAGACKVLSWLNVPFAAICIPVAIIVLYFAPNVMFGFRYPNIQFAGFNLFRVGFVSFVLSTAYTLYMPARYNASFSFLKNTLYNGLGLISGVYKWSFVAGYLLSVPELLKTAQSLFSRRYDVIPLLIAAILAGGTLLIIEAARALVKQIMK